MEVVHSNLRLRIFLTGREVTGFAAGFEGRPFTDGGYGRQATS